MRAFVFSTLVGGLFLLIGLASCGEYPVELVPVCRDANHQRVPCCGKWPDTHPCPDGGVDDDAGADADASDDGDVDAGAEDGGPPADVVCPWACTPTGGAGFDPFPSYVWIGEEGEMPPP